MTNKKVLALYVLLVSSLLGWMVGNVLAAGNTDAISASVTINNYCTFTVSNTAISFGSLNPGANTLTTSNTVTVTDTGNLGSNILTSGTSWTYASNNFGVQNTVWSASGSTAYGSGTVLTLSSVDSKIVVTTSTANSIYYGLGVPAGQAPGTYSQTINIISSC